MIKRQLKARMLHLLKRNPAVVLLGPRQVGKTTLAFDLVEDQNALYLDLERPRDLTKLSDMELFCQMHPNQLLILDEVHRVPDLFAALRGIIDERRRANHKNGHFLLLGSASLDLLQQSGETLAGRIAYCELNPIQAHEVEQDQIFRLWNRGGFPDSLLAEDDCDSLEWRQNFIRTYLERDVPQFGPRIPEETLRRFWTMLAHNQGATFNAAALARALGVKGVTVSRYLDLMVDLLLVRRLQPWTSNQGKRLIKSPKTYVRDSGICHALLGIKTAADLLGHPVSGGSWEGFVIEQIIAALPPQASYGHYRATGGAEIDLIVDRGGGEIWAIEMKRSTSPTLTRGFYHACEDVQPTRKMVIHAGPDSYFLSKDIEAVSIMDLAQKLNRRSST